MFLRIKPVTLFLAFASISSPSLDAEAHHCIRCTLSRAERVLRHIIQERHQPIRILFPQRGGMWTHELMLTTRCRPVVRCCTRIPAG